MPLFVQWPHACLGRPPSLLVGFLPCGLAGAARLCTGCLSAGFRPSSGSTPGVWCLLPHTPGTSPFAAVGLPPLSPVTTAAEPSWPVRHQKWRMPPRIHGGRARRENLSCARWLSERGSTLPRRIGILCRLAQRFRSAGNFAHRAQVYWWNI